MFADDDQLALAESAALKNGNLLNDQAILKSSIRLIVKLINLYYDIGNNDGK